MSKLRNSHHTCLSEDFFQKVQHYLTQKRKDFHQNFTHRIICLCKSKL